MGSVANCSPLMSLLKYQTPFCCGPLRAYRESKIAEQADRWIEVIKSLPRVGLAEADSNKTIKEAKKFTEDYASVLDKSTIEKINNCKREIFAYKLGITTEVLNNPLNNGFEQFANKPPLSRYLMKYGHTLELDENGEIIIKVDSREFGGITKLEWSEVKSTIESWEPINVKPKCPWTYGPHGVWNKDMYSWETVKPHMRVESGKYDNKFVFIFRACITRSEYAPNFQGDHCYAAVVKPNGNEISVGLNLEAKRYTLEAVPTALSVKDAYFQSPDVTDYWPCNVYELPFEITEQEYFAMKAKIERDKALEHEGRTFQILHSNCVLWTKEVAAISANYRELETQMSGARLLAMAFLPHTIVKISDCISQYLPNIVLRICNFVSGVFVNIISLVLGGHKFTCKQIKIDNGAEAHLNTFWDVFDTSKPYLHHPFFLAKVVFPRILEWRKKEIEKVNARQDIDDEEKSRLALEIKYKLPEKESLK